MTSHSRATTQSLEQLLTHGESALDAGKTKTAVQTLTKAVSLEPKSVTAHFYLALAYLKLGDLQNADKHARQVTQLSPQEPNAYLNLGVIRIKQGRTFAAERCYKQEIRLYPDCLEAHYNLGLLFLNQKKWRAAVTHLEKCWRNNHYAPDLAKDLAFAAQCAHRFDLEDEIYQSELRHNARSVWALNNLAALRNQQGRHEEARALLNMAMEISPSDSMVRRNLRYTPQ
ncbi:MAG: tetratricopeptide repeat protein [Verrucomicrobiales bacterium]